MIQKHYILYNVDASQKVTMLEFDLALFKDHYTITKVYIVIIMLKNVLLLLLVLKDLMEELFNNKHLEI